MYETLRLACVLLTVLTLFRPDFFWSSTTGGGGILLPELREYKSYENETWRAENVSFYVRIMRL